MDYEKEKLRDEVEGLESAAQYEKRQFIANVGMTAVSGYLSGGLSMEAYNGNVRNNLIAAVIAGFISFFAGKAAFQHLNAYGSIREKLATLTPSFNESGDTE